jgi:protocatechuate 3,4-dioxygenase beta subunit
MSFTAALLLASAARGEDFNGTVLTPDRKPAKNATVLFFPYDKRNSTDPNYNPPTTRCDDSGAFAFKNVPAGGEILATADGYALAAVPSAAAAKQIVLHPRTDVTLTFKDPTGKPAAGIPVRALSIIVETRGEMLSEYLCLPRFASSPWAATTDANGSCVIPALPQGGQLELAIDDDHFANLTYRDRVLLTDSPKTQANPIQLAAAASLSGKITFASSAAPAPNIQVIAFSPASGGNAETTTAADGTYAFKQLQAGDYTVSVSPQAPIAQTFTAKAVQDLNLAAGASKTGVDLSLIPGVTLTGSVIAADDGSPVPGVQIGIYGPAHPQEAGTVLSVQSDASGHFTAHVPPGEQLVYVMSQTPADGFSRPSPDNKHITVSDGAPPPDIEFRLPRVLMSPLKGKVIDADGNPAAGATVFAASQQTQMFQNTPYATAADGSFSTMPMLRTGKIEIRAKFKDQATAKPIVITHISGDVTIQLQRNALASIAGRVIDAAGQPIKGAQIELITQTARFSTGTSLGASDANGQYKADGLWADTNYFIEANQSGYGMAETGIMHPQAGEAVAAHDLTLYKRDSSVAGVLLDADDKPLGGQQIFVNGPKTGYNNLLTDSAGKFTCTVVSGDRLTIFFRTGRGYSRQAAKAGDQNIILHAAPPRRPPPPTFAQPPAEASSSAPPTPSLYNPADAVTWTAWLYAAVLLVVGGAITVVANAIAALRRKPA